MADAKYGNQDCAMYRDLRELLARRDIDAVLIATGPNWHAPGVRPGGQGRQGRVLREALHEEHLGRAWLLAGRSAGHGRVFQAGTQRRSLPNFVFAVDLARRGKLGKLQTLHAHPGGWEPAAAAGHRRSRSRPRKRWTGTCTSAPRPGGRSTRELLQRRQLREGRRAWSAAAAWNGASHCVDLCQWANDADAHGAGRILTRRRPVHARYANGVKLVMRNDGWLPLGSCPVRFEGETGWVETGDDGELLRQFAGLDRQGRQDRRLPGQLPRAGLPRLCEVTRADRAPTPTWPARRTSPVTPPTSPCSWAARSTTIR